MTPRETELTPAMQRYDTVDVLRGISILSVVLLHTWLRFYLNGYDLRQGLPPMAAHLLFRNGGNGVTIFFAVSGFLITLTSIRRFGSLSRMEAWVFYRIRFARIAPLLLLLLAVLSALALLHVEGFQFSAKRAPLWRAILSALTFHLNWLEARYGYLPANWDVLWSLSVEEMFYLFFPLVCLGLLRFRGGMAAFVAVLLAFVAMGPFARTVWSSNPIWQEKTYLGGMDGIALGCLTALVTQALSAREGGLWTARHRPFLLGLQWMGVAILLVTALGPGWFWKIFPFKADVYGTLLALAACLVMLASVLRQRGRPAGRLSRWTAPIRWYGRHSYEIYMTHEFFVVWGVMLFLRWHPHAAAVSPAAPRPGLLYFACWCLTTVLLTAALGWAVGRYVSGGRRVHLTRVRCSR